MEKLEIEQHEILDLQKSQDSQEPLVIKQKRRKYKKNRRKQDIRVEMALERWCNIAVKRGFNISCNKLVDIANSIAENLGKKDFEASSSWLYSWRKQHDINFKNKFSTDTTVEFGNDCNTFLESFRAEDIYNADETGLYYCAAPDGSLFYESECQSVLEYNKAMDHITILLCVNMLGTDKRKPLIIGKQPKSDCIEILTNEDSEIDYHTNESAWMTAKLFCDWISSWDLELQSTGRKILLLLSPCIVHPPLDNLKNIKLQFLPSNVPSLVQPMRVGLIENFKTIYRNKLVEFILDGIYKEVFSIGFTAKQVSERVSLSQAIKFIIESWKAIKTSTIQNTFAVSGLLRPLETDETFIIASLSLIENNENTKFSILNDKEFILIDDDLLCYQEGGEVNVHIK